MIAVLVTLLVAGTFMLMIIAMFDDIDSAVDDAELEELWDEACTGCGRHFVKPGCPVHDEQKRLAA